jgi:hypothetical protein
MTKTLEQYLKDAIEAGAIDFRIRASVSDGCVSFYIHPLDRDGETRDFQVRGNLTRPDPRVTYGDCLAVEPKWNAERALDRVLDERGQEK